MNQSLLSAKDCAVVLWRRSSKFLRAFWCLSSWHESPLLCAVGGHPFLLFYVRQRLPAFLCFKHRLVSESGGFLKTHKRLSGFLAQLQKSHVVFICKNLFPQFIWVAFVCFPSSNNVRMRILKCSFSSKQLVLCHQELLNNSITITKGRWRDCVLKGVKEEWRDGAGAGINPPPITLCATVFQALRWILPCIHYQAPFSDTLSFLYFYILSLTIIPLRWSRKSWTH